MGEDAQAYGWGHSVIFNEADAKITDKRRFFRNKDGEVYGFTVGGKIYIDPRKVNAETPLHEYAHLWAEALRKMNPQEWQNVVELMKSTPVWDEVKRKYAELATDDEIADEVIAQYSSRKGAEKLRAELEKVIKEDGDMLDKAAAVTAFERVRKALKGFWKAVADFLHIHYNSTEEVLKDFLDGVNPMSGGKDLASQATGDMNLRFQKEQEERTDDTLYRSDDAIKNKIETLFNQAISGEFKGKPVYIGRLTDEGKAYLEEISGVTFKDKVDFVLNPSDLVHIYKDHFGSNEKDKGQNVPLGIEYIRNLVDIISTPDNVIFFKEGEGSNRNMFYFFKETEDGTYNLMEIYSDRKGNLTAKTFYKTRKDATQRVMDIEKSLLPTSETYSGAILSSTKIPQMFESTSVDDDFSTRDGVGDELSFENDPISKMLGKPRYTRKQRREFAERFEGGRDLYAGS